MLHLDFSQVGGTIEKLEENFNFYLGMQLDGFINEYAEYYSEETKEKIKSTDYAGGKLGLIQRDAKSKGYPLYLIIDEYDNFTNTVLNEQGEDVYWAITHAEGFYRDIFKKFKGSFERIFITGVSPVTLDDVTSGFNIGWHISTKEKFNQMLGFSTEDVNEIFNYYQKAGKIPADRNIEAIIDEMKPWYDNYFISLLFYYGMLTIKGTLGDQLVLGIPNNNVRKQYYNYLLEQYQDERCLNINNLRTMFTYMAYEGKWRECLEFMAKAYSDLSSVRDSIEAEHRSDEVRLQSKNLQGFFMAYLSLTSYYYTAPELELNHGYCDFFLLPDLTHYATKHSYILELKVLSKKEWDVEAKDASREDGTPMTKAEKQWEEAVEQIKRYAVAPRVEALRQGTQLHRIVMQFKGWELARMEEV